MTDRFSWPPSSPWWPQQQRRKNEEEAVARWAKSNQGGIEPMPQQLMKGVSMRKTENVDVSRETNSRATAVTAVMLLCVLFGVGASLGAAWAHSYSWLFAANCAFLVAFILLALVMGMIAED